MEVGWLDVAVDDSALVGVVQSVAHLRHHVECDFERQARRLLEQRREIHPFEQLHHDGNAGVCLVQLVDRDDVAVVQPRGGTGFLCEAATQLGVLIEVADQLLDRDQAVQHVVVAFEHDTHGAFADALDDRVAAVDELLFDGKSALIFTAGCRPSYDGTHAACR